MNKHLSLLSTIIIMIMFACNTSIISMNRTYSDPLESLMEVPSWDEYDQFLSKTMVLDDLRNQLLPSFDGNGLNNDDQKLPIRSRLNILGRSDKKNRALVDTLAYKRLLAYNSLFAHEIKQYIQNDFGMIANRLYKNELDAQSDLARAYGIDPTQPRWNMYIDQMNKRIEQEVVALRGFWGNTTWSENVPDNMRKALVEVLAQHQLEPSAFNVMVVDGSSVPVYYEAAKLEDLGMYGYTVSEPACIKLGSNVGEQSDVCATYAANHIIAHALNGNNTKSNYIVQLIHMLSKANIEDIKMHPAYTTFMVALGMIADIRHALADPYVARCTRLMSYLYPGSYGYIAAIDLNWQILKALENKK